MAYTDTPQDFFAKLEKLAANGPLLEGVGTVSFDIEGEGGGAWLVDFSSGRVTKGTGESKLTVRARAGDFMALVEGRMSPSDGVLTDRLELAGDAVAATKLGAFLATLSGRPTA